MPDDRRRRAPFEDKRLDFERQSRGFSEYHHAMRHGKWRRKRRAAQKAYRHEVLVRLALAARGAGAEPAGGGRAAVRDRADAGAVARKVRRKWRPSKLGAWVDGQRQGRVDFVAHNYFKSPYRADVHRVAFAAFLESVVAGRGPGSRALACRFGPLLEPDVGGREGAWLRAFLRDEPAWRARLAAWVGALAGPAGAPRRSTARRG
jgi:hypothetical protein